MHTTKATGAPTRRAWSALPFALGVALVASAFPAAALGQDEAEPPHDQPGPAADRLLALINIVRHISSRTETRLSLQANIYYVNSSFDFFAFTASFKNSTAP